MKHYAGDRTIDGVKVTVDGAPLDVRRRRGGVHQERIRVEL